MSVPFKNYYQTLGVSPDATGEEIRKGFRSLARKYHPDVAKDKATAEERFKELNEAHEVLSDPESRRKYDHLRAAGPNAAGNPPGSPDGDTAAGPGRGEPDGAFEFHFQGTGFSDFFERYFGGRAAAARGASPSQPDAAWADGGPGDPEDRAPDRPLRGNDIEGDILITLDEVLHGAVREIVVRRVDPRTRQDETATSVVRIPAGVRAGQSVRVSGRGGEGSGGGRAGDIYLRVRYAEHPDWKVHRADLLGELKLAPWEAVLGATVPVRTLDATLFVKVPPGTRQGNRLRIRGRGLPAGAGGRGDVTVEVSIQVPARVGPEDTLLWQQLAARSTFDPRQA